MGERPSVAKSKNNRPSSKPSAGSSAQAKPRTGLKKNAALDVDQAIQAARREGEKQRRLRAQYRKAHASPRQTLSFVAFVDVLGVRQMMLTAEDDERALLLERLRGAYTAALPDLRDLMGADREAGGTVNCFTDNIVITHPVWPREGAFTEQSIGAMVIALTYLQMGFALHGFFLRGGIDVGEVYVDDDMVFGDALLNAYQAESQAARDPRIVFTDAAKETYLSTMDSYSRAADTPHFYHTLIDIDEAAFVNYLTIAYTETDDGEPRIDLVEQHRDVVAAKLREYANSPPVLSKYQWVAKYHNMLVLESGLPVRLLVPNELMTSQPRRITSAEFSRYKAAANRVRRTGQGREFVLRKKPSK